MLGRSRAAKFRASMGGKKVKATSRTFEFANVNSAKSYAKAARSLSSTLSVALQNGNRVTLSTNNPKDMRRATVLANATIRGTVKASNVPETVSASSSFSITCESPGRARNLALALMKIDGAKVTTNGSKVQASYDAKHTGKVLLSAANVHQRSVAAAGLGKDISNVSKPLVIIFIDAKTAAQAAKKLQSVSPDVKVSQQYVQVIDADPKRALAVARQFDRGAKIDPQGGRHATFSAAADPSNLKYMFKSEAAASKSVDSVLRMGKGLKAAYKGNGAVVLRPGNYAAEISDLAKQSGGKPAGAAVSAAGPPMMKAFKKNFPSPKAAAYFVRQLAANVAGRSLARKAQTKSSLVTIQPVTPSDYSMLAEFARVIIKQYAPNDVEASNVPSLRLSRRAKFELSQSNK